MKNNLEKTLRTLSQREKDLDIQLSDFIESNFRKVKLFHSFNHPNCTILAYIANTILKHLEIDTFFSLETEPDLLSTISFPLYSSLRKHLTINFIENEKYFLRQEYFSRENIIQLFFDYYKSHPDLVKLNLEFYQ